MHDPPRKHEKKREGSESYCCCCYCYNHRSNLLTPTQLEHGHYHCLLPFPPPPPLHHSSSPSSPPKLALRPILLTATSHAASCPELELNRMLPPTHPSLPSAYLPPTSIAGTYRESICSPPFRAPTCSSARRGNLHFPLPTRANESSDPLFKALTRLHRQGGARARRAHVGTCWQS